MRFRPCIDIHNGKVKQIVGGSLKDEENHAETNFTSERRAGYFAEMYQRDGLSGGHVILLNPPASEYYGETLKQAEEPWRHIREDFRPEGAYGRTMRKSFLTWGQAM